MESEWRDFLFPDKDKMSEEQALRALFMHNNRK